MREGISLVLLVSLMAFIYASSISLTDTFERSGIRAFENPDDPFNVLYFLLVLLLLTIIILAISRFWRKEIVYVIFLIAIILTSFTVFQALLITLIREPHLSMISLLLSILVALSLVFYPEWYILDICATLLSIGAITIFGISLSIPLVMVLLVALAIYDVVSVYKTKHMIDLADTIVDLKLPALFIIPYRFGYRFRRKAGGIKKQVKRKEREALFVGVGDVVIPGILVVSSYARTSSLIIAGSVSIGIMLSFIALSLLVSKGRPQAGLPFLNAGAILGYLISSLILYGYPPGIT